MPIQNISELVTALRRYKKNDIANVSSDHLWNIFRNKEDYTTERAQVVNSYAPKLIMLALATANNFRDNTLTDAILYNFCHDFLGIRDPINDKPFMDNESKEIVENLRNKKIPDKYLNQEIVREICPILFLTRSIRQQHEGFLAGTNEFYMTYDILARLDAETKGQLYRDFQAIYQLSPLHFMRAAFGLFALGNDKNGRLICPEFNRH